MMREQHIAKGRRLAQLGLGALFCIQKSVPEISNDAILYIICTLLNSLSIHGPLLPHIHELPPSSMKVAYLGPNASFSHQAAREVFQTPVAELNALPSFADIFEGVQSSHFTYGVVPFENSSNGSVVQLLDLLADRQLKYGDVKVCAEHYLPVHHQLLVKQDAATQQPGLEQALKRMEKFYTHPQAWGQCSAFLTRTDCRSIARQDSSSTAEAARVVSEHEAGTCAAIASRLAGEQYGLVRVADNIEDKGDNTTRFFVLARADHDTLADSALLLRRNGVASCPGIYKNLVSFTIDHESPGTLAEALAIFKKHDFNLTSINTRPSRLRPWHYIFFAECERKHRQHQTDAVTSLIADLGHVALSCRHLGSWEDQLMRH
jgi:prephenate dehydratase